MMDPNTDGGNIFHQIAHELAERADAEATARHPQLAHAHAELALVYLAFATHAPAGEHGDKAWQAAESARDFLVKGTALGAAADTTRARLHLKLDALEAASIPRPR